MTDAGTAQRRKWFALALLASTQFVIILDAAIVNVAMVTNMFAEGAERNKALGVWGAVSGSGGAAGVLLGGVLPSTPAGSGCCGSTCRSA